MQKKQKPQKNLPTYQPTNLLTLFSSLFLVSWFFSLSASPLKANNLDLVIDIAKAKQIDYLAQRINAVYDYANVYVLQQGTVDTVSKSALKLNLDTGDEVYKAYETNTDFDISITSNKQNIQFTNILPANSTQRTINILKRSPYLHPFAYVDGQTVVIPLKPSTLDLLNKLSSAKAKSNTVVSLTQPSDTSKVWYKPNGSGGYEVYSYVNNVWTPLSSSDQKVQTPVLTDASQLNSLTATKGDGAYLIQNEKAIKYIYDGTTWLKEGGSSGATNASGTCDATQIGSIRYSVDDDKMQHCASSGWVDFGDDAFGNNPNPYFWFEPENFGECSKQCGGGIQSKDVLCQNKTEDNNTVEDKYCLKYEAKPVIQQSCNTQECPKELLPATGQTTSYVNFDDGHYKLGIPRTFTRDNAKEVVTDHATGLMWQDNSEAKTKMTSWSNATSYCTSLSLGGYTNWRLPDVKELTYIVDLSKYSPSIYSVFQNVSAYNYWSSSTHARYSDRAWYVRFITGYSSYYDNFASNYVRCVRTADN
jgi:hypothetical protein